MAQTNNSMVFGLRPVIEAIEAGQQIDRLFMQRGLKGETAAELMKLARTHDIEPVMVPSAKLNRLTRKNHQGVVGFISPIAFQSLESLVPMIYEQGSTPLVLILDEITDIRNFGAIVRTAEGAGVHAIVIPHRGAAQVNSDAVKTSAGALFRIPVCKVHSLTKAVDFLQLSGYQIAACSEKGSSPYHTFDFTGPLAVVMGSEEYGVSKDVLRKVEHIAQIPMRGKIGSLNVSVACGILLYEVIRQRFVAIETTG